MITSGRRTKICTNRCRSSLRHAQCSGRRCSATTCAGPRRRQWACIASWSQKRLSEFDTPTDSFALLHLDARWAGRRFSVALLGNHSVETLPHIEVVSGQKDKICPATIDKVYARRILEVAKATFRVRGCRDYARIDIRFGETGTPSVIGVGTVGILDRGRIVRAGGRSGRLFPLQPDVPHHRSGAGALPHR